ncbi:MAG: hypothetical protein ACC608_08050 [Anaerofustis sp.]
MNNNRSVSNHLASYAIFSELYNSGKNDIFEIIAEFIKETISDKRLYTFSLEQVVGLLRSEYAFSNIPSSVVKTALRKIDYIEKIYNRYSVTNIQAIKSEIDSKMKGLIIEKNNTIIRDLYKYASDYIGRAILNEDKVKLLDDFCQFILDDSNGNDNSALIGSFILKNINNQDFENQLNSIKEGVVIYHGLNFDNTPNAVSSWKKEAVYFLEMEILFHLVGYNGTLFQEMVLDFSNLVEEINKNNNKKIIKFKYFKETKEEIESFFNTAELIIRGQAKLDPSKTAMNSILEGCKSASDIILKKTEFFMELEKKHITIDDYDDYYRKYNHEYNLEDKEYLYDESEETHKIRYYKTILSHINVRRKGQIQERVQDVEYLLVSENQTIRQMAREINDAHQGYSIPLAISLSSITNKLWVQLSKGLGNLAFPKSLQIITKVQIVLSKLINNSVAKSYDELIKKGSVPENKDKIIASILDLRQQVKKPEEIIEEDSDDIYKMITGEDLFDFDRKAKLENQKKEELQKERDDLQSELELAKINLKEIDRIRLSELEKSYERLSNRDAKCKRESEKKIKRFKGILILLIVFGVFSISFLIIKLHWESYTFLANFFPFVFGYIYLIIVGKTANPLESIKNKQNKIKSKVYNKYDFDEDEYKQITEKKLALQSSLDCSESLENNFVEQD